MKLVHPNLKNQIILSENIINVITIENKILFRNLLQEFILQTESDTGAFVLSEKNKEYDISKLCEIIIDPFHLDFNNRKNLNKIYSTLKDLSISENNYLTTTKLKSEILKYIDKLIFNYTLPLTYDDDFDITTLFKSLNIKIETETYSIIEKIIYYISVIMELTPIQYFVFVNLKQFLNYDELAELYKTANYKKFQIILFENTYCETNHECEKHYIIDTDLCEIF